MRKFEIHIEMAWSGVKEIETFEMPDDATEEDIEQEAKGIFYNYCNFGVKEITDE